MGALKLFDLFIGFLELLLQLCLYEVKYLGCTGEKNSLKLWQKLISRKIGAEGEFR